MAETRIRTPKSGKHPEKVLSAAFVRTVKDAGKYLDGHGLSLVVDPSGAKRWVQRITVRGKRREMGLGAASLVSLAEAREKALYNRKLARSGGDPLAEKRKAQSVLSFEDAAREVHRINAPSWRNKKHAAQFIATLETYAFPSLARIPVSDVNTADVLMVLQPIWLEKPETARRVRQRIGTVMKWAVAKGWRQDNPAENIGQALPKQDRAQAHRKALHYNEVAACLDAVRACRANETTKLALEFLVLTAARSGEVRLAEWSEFDLAKAVWVIPASRMKAKREHRVPLSPRAIDLLRGAQAFGNGDGLVFPGQRAGRPLSENTFVKLLRDLGFEADAHGFRTSFKTWAQERSNMPREVSEAALAHVISNKAEAAYARSDFFEKRRRMMEGWAAHLVSGQGQVVRLA